MIINLRLPDSPNDIVIAISDNIVATTFEQWDQWDSGISYRNGAWLVWSKDVMNRSVKGILPGDVIAMRRTWSTFRHEAFVIAVKLKNLQSRSDHTGGESELTVLMST